MALMDAEFWGAPLAGLCKLPVAGRGGVEHKLLFTVRAAAAVAPDAYGLRAVVERAAGLEVLASPMPLEARLIGVLGVVLDGAAPGEWLGPLSCVRPSRLAPLPHAACTA